MASSTRTNDDGFHEIQLNGKQLVFLFMAVTVVSAVIFLCGVLVGRGVRLERGDVVSGAGVTMPAGSDAVPPVPVDASGNTSQPTAGVEDLTYPGRLEPRSLPGERLSPQAEPPPAKAEAPAEPTARQEVPAALPAADVAPGDPGGPGVAVQVSAFRDRREADVLARRLIGKGFQAYVVDPAAGAPALYRVRVGRFKDRAEASRAADRLKKEEQFEPWIVP